MESFRETHAVGYEVFGEEKMAQIIRRGMLAGTIKKMRGQRNMHPQDLADAIGVPLATLGRIEQTLTVPDEALLKKIEHVLDFTFPEDVLPIEINQEVFIKDGCQIISGDQ